MKDPLSAVLRQCLGPLAGSLEIPSPVETSFEDVSVPAELVVEDGLERLRAETSPTAAQVAAEARPFGDCPKVSGLIDRRAMAMAPEDDAPVSSAGVSPIISDRPPPFMSLHGRVDRRPFPFFAWVNPDGRNSAYTTTPTPRHEVIALLKDFAEIQPDPDFKEPNHISFRERQTKQVFRFVLQTDEAGPRLASVDLSAASDRSQQVALGQRLVNFLHSKGHVGMIFPENPYFADEVQAQNYIDEVEPRPYLAWTYGVKPAEALKRGLIGSYLCIPDIHTELYQNRFLLNLVRAGHVKWVALEMFAEHHNDLLKDLRAHPDELLHNEVLKRSLLLDIECYLAECEAFNRVMGHPKMPVSRARKVVDQARLFGEFSKLPFGLSDHPLQVTSDMFVDEWNFYCKEPADLSEGAAKEGSLPLQPDHFIKKRGISERIFTGMLGVGRHLDKSWHSYLGDMADPRGPYLVLLYECLKRGIPVYGLNTSRNYGIANYTFQSEGNIAFAGRNLVWQRNTPIEGPGAALIGWSHLLKLRDLRLRYQDLLEHGLRHHKKAQGERIRDKEVEVVNFGDFLPIMKYRQRLMPW